MPDADTVWLTRLDEMLTCLKRVGLVVHLQYDCSVSHHAVADALIDAFAADAAEIAAKIGPRALKELLMAHRLWSDWLRAGRVRKIAFVADKTEPLRNDNRGQPTHKTVPARSSSSAKCSLGRPSLA
jgi:hypothetical protein